MSKVLLTGMSGTGKSAVLAELGRRGYRVVDTDDKGLRGYRPYVDSSDELHRGELLWVEDRMTRRSSQMMVALCSLQDLATIEPLLRAGCTHELDTSRPLADIVDDLLAIASRPIATA